MEREVSGTNPGGVEDFCTHKEKWIYTKDHELNYLACRSRAILPTFVGLCLIAALIFSAGYYSAPIFFLLRRIKKFSLYLILPPFQHFAWNLFDFSRLVSLFSHSAKSNFEHQLLSKAIQDEQSQYEKLKSEVETG